MVPLSSSFLSKKSFRSITARVGNDRAMHLFQVIFGSIQSSKDHRAMDAEKIQLFSVRHTQFLKSWPAFFSLIRQECCYENALRAI